MRTWFWTFLVFIAAVALALVLRDHSGNVLILVHPWRIELSLTFTVLVLIGLFIVMHLGLRLLSWVLGSPEKIRSWRYLKAQKRDHNLLENGWMNVLEGRYEQADSDLSKLLGKTRSQTSKVVAGLAAARAAHRLGEPKRRDEILNTANHNAIGNDRLKESVSIVAAEIYLDDGKAQEALELLKPLQDASSRYLNASKLLLRAHKQLGNHDRVYDLTRLLSRRGVLDQTQSQSYITEAIVHKLQNSTAESFKTIWSDLKAEEKHFPEIAYAAAQLQTNLENYDKAAKILEEAIQVNMDTRLLGAYAKCPAEHVKRRLSKAESWLKTNPENTSLLICLGFLCITSELWGQAEMHLQKSLEINNDIRVHALLGNLYDSINKPDEATKHWRLATNI